jgi:hypothetical protein
MQRLPLRFRQAGVIDWPHAAVPLTPLHAQVLGVLVSERQGYEFGGETELQALRALAARIAVAAQRCVQLAGQQQAASGDGWQPQGMDVMVRGELQGGNGAGVEGSGAGGGVEAQFRVVDGSRDQRWAILGNESHHGALRGLFPELRGTLDVLRSSVHHDSS